MFIDGFKSSKVCRHFVYLWGVLYGLASSRKVLSFERPRVLGDDDKTGATMGCLGVSNDLVCYVTCDGSNTFCFWNSLVWGGGADTMFIPGADIVFKLYAISLNAHVIFYGTLELIFIWDFERQKCKLFNKSKLNLSVHVLLTIFHLIFFLLNRSGNLLKGAEISNCFQVVRDRSYWNMLFKRRFLFPSEMQLCAGMELPD
ncbi:unnamed protein product [Malus baccata var. baccata]